MSNNTAKTWATISLVMLLFVGILVYRPGYFSSSSGLVLLIGGEVLLAAVATFRKTFLPLVVLSFLIAGTGLPFHFEFLQARWVVLGIGAVVGLAVYMKTHSHRFGTFHLIALFCVLSAFVSALVSAYPGESRLKAVSLFLLFLYVSAGARTAVGDDPTRFFRTLVRCAEVLVIGSACGYLIFRWRFFGNPNSLGAIMAVVAVPLLLWGYLNARSRPERLRLNVGLVLALLLLLSSFARASIGAAALSCCLVCWSTREFRLLIKGVALASVLAVCAALFVPHEADTPALKQKDSIVGAYVYKGKEDQGFWGSRRSAWQQTWSVIRERPWFGSGFGTSQISEDMTKLDYAAHHIDSWVVREHGNSYLAIMEWTGLLGVVPFFALVVLVAANAGTTLLFVRRTRDASSVALPAAAVAVAGLAHATFEDWLFAVGYYVCVFFWCVVFIMIDVMPSPVVAYSSEPTAAAAADPPYGAVVPAR